jgi:D-amino peptidase
MRVELVERGRVPLPATKPYMRVIDGRTYEVDGASVEEALWRLG